MYLKVVRLAASALAIAWASRSKSQPEVQGYVECSADEEKAEELHDDSPWKKLLNEWLDYEANTAISDEISGEWSLAKKDVKKALNGAAKPKPVGWKVGKVLRAQHPAKDLPKMLAALKVYLAQTMAVTSVTYYRDPEGVTYFRAQLTIGNKIEEKSNDYELFPICAILYRLCDDCLFELQKVGGPDGDCQLWNYNRDSSDPDYNSVFKPLDISATVPINGLEAWSAFVCGDGKSTKSVDCSGSDHMARQIIDTFAPTVLAHSAQRLCGTTNHFVSVALGGSALVSFFIQIPLDCSSQPAHISAYVRSPMANSEGDVVLPPLGFHVKEGTMLRCQIPHKCQYCALAKKYDLNLVLEYDGCNSDSSSSSSSDSSSSGEDKQPQCVYNSGSPPSTGTSGKLEVIFERAGILASPVAMLRFFAKEGGELASLVTKAAKADLKVELDGDWGEVANAAEGFAEAFAEVAEVAGTIFLVLLPIGM